MKYPAFRFALPLAALLAPQIQAAVLEEVVVTAQLRSQSLADVPVSVSAVSGDKIFEAGIAKAEDLSAYVPNLTIQEVGLGTSIYIRGIGSGENQGFEQSVGTYIDGIYYGRAQLARAPFLDLAQVEVLRGPQNILYGKNSIGGAISIRTADPTQEFMGKAAVTIEPRYNEHSGDLMLSGPVTDEWALRFAVRARQTDGYMTNQITGEPEPQRDEYTVRLKSLWDVSDSSTLKLKLEHGSFDVVGRQTEVITDSPSVSTVPFFTGRTYGEIMADTNFFVPGTLLTPELGLFLNEHPSVLDSEGDYRSSRQKDTSENNTYNITVEYDWYVGEQNFTSITGYLQYDYTEECDCDYSGVRLFQLDLEEDYSQFSQELRWISPVGDTWEFIGGAYVQYSDLDFFDSIKVDSPVLPRLINAADLLEGGARGDIDPDLTAGLGTTSFFGIGDAGNALAGIRSPRFFDSESIVASVFLQGAWNISETLRLTLGGRFTYENKTGARDLNFAFADGSIQPISEVDSAAAISFAAERHDLKGERSENNFSPLVNLQWYATDQVMLYGNLSRGAKAGGYDARSNSSPDPTPTPANPLALNPNRVSLIGSFEYEPETATSAELGSKMSLFDGAGELNLALFYTEFDDLQVSVFDGTLGFNVGNAASAISQGLEIDGRLALSEHWLIGGGASLMSFKYEDHLAGTCVQGQTPNAPNGINCDYTGKTGQYVADYSGNLLIGYERALFDSLLLRANLDVIFTDDYNPSPNLDERVAQPAYQQFNARIALSDIYQTWEVAIAGKNLSDEQVYVYTQDLPSAYTIAETATHFGFQAARRTVSLQLTYNW
ncbi:MAG: TonB-dependent receptor [Spongiibacteraceae bacterium]|nr:TonB-dependent receptor [Spongiibacteraceae bacterium]